MSAQHLDSLVKVQRNNFLHTVLDHLRGEEVGFSFFVDSDLPKIFKQNGTNGFGGVGHVDGSIVAHHLTHVGQRTTVVQVEMTENKTGGAINVTTQKFYIYVDIVSIGREQYRNILRQQT